MLKSSKIPTGQTLENFDFAFQPAIERSRIETLATGAWIRNAEVLLLQGPPGVGKSHLLVGLGVRAIQLSFSVQYFRFDELLTALKVDAPLRPGRLKARKYMSTALLLVDRMGYDPMTRDEASLFFRLVSSRYGRGAMIITTNKSIRDWTELLAGDEVLATATPSRSRGGRALTLAVSAPATAAGFTRNLVKPGVALAGKTGSRLTTDGKRSNRGREVMFRKT
jgi:DNA replication protein DnaC